MNTNIELNKFKYIWTCKYCNLTFKTRKEMYDHARNCKEKCNCELDSIGRIKHTKDYTTYNCTFCNKVLIGKQNFTYHINFCYKNPNRKIPLNKGHSLSKTHKESISKGTKKYLSLINKNGGARYSKEACDFIDKLNIEMNWNLQHALNGGEITVGPYYLDGYDKEKNIVFEYDEIKHYLDPINNVLNEKDLIRQNNIIKILNCEFYRYNKYIGKLYKVN